MKGGFGGMLSVRVKGGERAAIATAARVELWKRATSLGGVESLIEHRASIEGPGTPCPPDLLRLSVGVEDAERPFDDLDRALRRPRCGYGGGVRHGVTTTSSKRGRGVSCSRRRLAAMMVPLISPPNRKMAARVYRKTSAAMAVARPPYIEA